MRRIIGGSSCDKKPNETKEGVRPLLNKNAQRFYITSLMINEFVCSGCGENFIGEPSVVKGGAILCSGCKEAPLFSIREIADYISGWATGPYESVQEVGRVVLHNALNQLQDDQDGIDAVRRRQQTIHNKGYDPKYPTFTQEEILRRLGMIFSPAWVGHAKVIISKNDTLKDQSTD